MHGPTFQITATMIIELHWVRTEKNHQSTVPPVVGGEVAAVSEVVTVSEAAAFSEEVAVSKVAAVSEVVVVS